MVNRNRNRAHALDLRPDEALVTVTWSGQQGDLTDPVHFGLSDRAILDIAAEALRAGSVRGVRRARGVNLRDFVVDRFDASGAYPNRISVRPKTPFG